MGELDSSAKNKVLVVNFENLTVEFYVPYVLNMHFKFRSNQMLYAI